MCSWGWLEVQRRRGSERLQKGICVIWSYKGVPTAIYSLDLRILNIGVSPFIMANESDVRECIAGGLGVARERKWILWREKGLPQMSSPGKRLTLGQDTWRVTESCAH